MMMMTKMTMSHGFDDDNEELMMIMMLIMLMMTTKMKMSHSSVLKQVKLYCNRRGLQTSFPKPASQSPQHAKPPITVSKKSDVILLARAHSTPGFLKRCHSLARTPSCLINKMFALALLLLPFSSAVSVVGKTDLIDGYFKYKVEQVRSTFHDS